MSSLYNYDSFCRLLTTEIEIVNVELAIRKKNFLKDGNMKNFTPVINLFFEEIILIDVINIRELC